MQAAHNCCAHSRTFWLLCFVARPAATAGTPSSFASALYTGAPWQMVPTPVSTRYTASSLPLAASAHHMPPPCLSASRVCHKGHSSLVNSCAHGHACSSTNYCRPPQGQIRADDMREVERGGAGRFRALQQKNYRYGGTRRLQRWQHAQLPCRPQPPPPPPACAPPHS
jgi:hypothetical protein